MRSSGRKVCLLLCLGFGFLTSQAASPSIQAGPIAEMLARHRQNRQMRLPPMGKPFSSQPVRDLSVKTSSLRSRFKQRFSFRRPSTEGVIPLNPDLGSSFSN